MTGSVLELHDTAVAYGPRTVLEIDGLRVRKGEVLTLLGENGSGKTTLLRIFGLLVKPDRGRVVFGGEDVEFGRSRRLLELRRRMATVMQEPLLCRMSVRKNVALGLRFRGVSGGEADRRVDAWLERLSISHLGERPAGTLSGGEAQRTSLARAMALDPEVLFLDEPFGALDAPTRQGLLQDLRGLLAESGVTAVFATHDRSEAVALGDRVVVLRDGRVAQVGPPETVFTRPVGIEIARLLGVDTLIPGRIGRREGELVEVECGELRLRARGAADPGRAVVVAVRPEEIELHRDPAPEAGPEANHLAGVVTRIFPAEAHHRVEIDCGARVVALVSRTRFRQMALDEGDVVHASFPAGAVHLIMNSIDGADSIPGGSL